MTVPPTSDAPLSLRSSRVKEARRLSRRSARTERRLFLAEGPKAVEAALGVEDCVVEVFATPDARQRYADLAAAAPAWTIVDERALDALSDAVTPAGVVAVCRFLDRPLTDLLGPRSRLVAICADVSDPGNAGTVIRCADAAGADGVVLAGRSVDAYNAKTVRASVGSIFHVPFTAGADTQAAIAAAQDAGLLVLAADGTGEIDLFEADQLLERRTAWVFGNEAHGLSSEVSALADHRVRIPIHGRAESLNLATAAVLCLYASARAQR